MPAPRCNFAKLYINDVYFGLYNNTEDVDRPLLEEAFAVVREAAWYVFIRVLVGLLCG